MNHKAIITILSLILIASVSNAQSDLYISREFQEAYKKQTRSKDGTPGPKYWQNNVDYKIQVEVIPESRLIVGSESVVYKNNGPDELRQIVIRLYYDVFKKGNKRAETVDASDVGEGVNLKTLSIDGKNIDLNNNKEVQRYGTNLYVNLEEHLLSREQLTLDVQWEQKIQLNDGRVGAIDETSFFVGYWYPQIAVYDDIFGWDRIDFELKNEFYNNLANFDVQITVPDNFLVWATGTLENSVEVLPAEIYNRYIKAKSSDSLVNVITSDDLKDLKLKSNTFNYKANEVSDFAFAISDHYLWNAISQKVDGNDVLISSVFPMNDVENYTEFTMVQKRAMKHFSEDLPGIPYPYPAFTTFIGNNGGMEFPMMANNSNESISTAIHEMFHMYYPMYVRINETRYGWMDEGWADFFTALLLHKYEKKEYDTSPLYYNFYARVMEKSGSVGDLPAIMSTQYTKENFSYLAYNLPAFIYYLLYQYFGEEKFMTIFREYTKRWALKSPTPYDFFYTFEDVSEEDLNWLWEPWFYRMGYPDVSIKSFDQGELVVEKIGARPIPISLRVDYQEKNDSSPKNFELIENASIWKGDISIYKVSIPDWENIKSISLNGSFPDLNEKDNFYPSLNSQYSKIAVNQDVIGIYKIKKWGLEIEIYEEDGVLVMEVDERKLILIPITPSNYTDKPGFWKISFAESNGRVNSMNLFHVVDDFKITAEKK